MILTKVQAEAVYKSMCELNNVGGTIAVNMNEIAEGTYIRVWENKIEGVRIVNVKAYTLIDNERYKNQAAFAKAYGLE